MEFIDFAIAVLVMCDGHVNGRVRNKSEFNNTSQSSR